MTVSPRRYWSSKCGQGEVVNWLRDHSTYVGDDCLIFPFARSKQRGYGQFGLNGEMLYAHRFMCELANGAAPSPLHQAAHSCGKGHTGCVTPKHLSWSTNSGNQLDRRKHGTKSKGRRQKVTPQQVKEIRALKGVETLEQIAARYDVKRGCIEYWHSHDRPPAPPGTSYSAVYRRRVGHR